MRGVLLTRILSLWTIGSLTNVIPYNLAKVGLTLQRISLNLFNHRGLYVKLWPMHLLRAHLLAWLSSFA